MSWKLGASVGLLVIAAIAGVVALTHETYYREIVAATRRGAQRETRLIRQALEHQMLDKENGLIQRMVAGFASRNSVERVMILDREGEVRYSSDPKVRARHFSAKSRTCQVCHQRPGHKRATSTLLELSQGTVLRCVQPILNRKRCHACHEPEHRINGVIIVDIPVERTRRAITASMRKLSFGAGGLALALLLGIGVTVRRLVIRRLLRFENTARAIADGQRDRRLPVEGGDALARVEQQFNSMADSVTGLLGQLEEQRADLEKVMNSVDDGMVVLDRQRRIVAANDAFTRRFPGASRDIIGSTCCQLGSTAGALSCCCGEAECPTLQCFDAGAVQMAVRERKLADGSTRQEEVRSSPVYTDGRLVTHVVEVWRDITDRRSAEAKLADYQRMVSLGMLASGFSHELNTPLGSIGTCLAGVQRVVGSEASLSPTVRDDLEDYVRIARTQVQRCGAITEQFLRLARGKTLAKEVVDLPSLVSVTVKLCRRAASERGVDVQRDTKQLASCSVLANSSAVQQVLLNLLHNAIEASGEGNTIWICCCTNDDGGTVIEVRDEGRGMPPEELAHVFEPFYTRRAEGGTGLGLFVSMNLARSWGGDISVHSAAGEGTTFTMLFPPPRDDDGASTGAT